MNKKMLSIVIVVGFAIFSMFFGAGNLVYPLAVGAHVGPQLDKGLIGFLISGIMIPLLGLFAISLYHGNYMNFFRHLGRLPGFMVAAAVIIILGLIVATPRTSLLSMGTWIPLVPKLSHYPMLFNAIFFLLIYVVSMKQNRIVDAIGWVLSPMKLSILFILIAFGLSSTHHELTTATADHASNAFTFAIKSGYGTMDLLAAFFFCSFVHRTIQYKLHGHAENTELLERRLTISACLLGAILLALIYSFFILVSNFHAAKLQGIATQNLIGSLSVLLLRGWGGLFVALCVTLACFSTAVALVAVTVEFFHKYVFCHRIHYHAILPIVLLITFTLSNLGFDMIMKIAIPMLTILYPPLLGLTIGNICYKIKKWNIGPYLFYIILVAEIIVDLVQLIEA